MSKYPYGSPEWQALEAEVQQRAGTEVPGFHARTVIDDTIGKLHALRSNIGTPVAEGLDALLDDIEELVEKAMDIGYDPDAPYTESLVPESLKKYGPGVKETMPSTGSRCLGECSCGGIFIFDGAWIEQP